MVTQHRNYGSRQLIFFTMSKIEINPLFVDLFDLPEQFVWTNDSVESTPVNNNRPRSRSGRRTVPRGGRRTSNNNTAHFDDGVETDNTESSLLHGESISLTDDEVVAASASDNRPSSFTTYRPNMVSLPVRLPAASSASDEFNRNNKKSQGDGFATQGSNNNTNTAKSSSSPKKKKKKRTAAIKSLKKLVGKKSGKPTSSILTTSSSFDETDSLISSSPSYVADNEKSPMTPQYIIDTSLSAERLSALQSTIGRIRSNIHTLEGDLIATRNELARAHQHLHLATSELADIQRAALTADIGVSKLMQHRQQHLGGMSISPSTSAVRLSPLNFYEADMSARSRSSSSDRLNYFTPTSSLVESGDDSSDCYTPRSTTSYQSLSSLNENGNNRINTPILDETTIGKVDKDRTPLKKNGKHTYKRRFKFDSSSTEAKKSSTVVVNTDCVDSIDTPSTAASTQNEVPNSELDDNTSNEQDNLPKEQGVPRVSFRQQSFIRAHDLELANTADNSALVCLHETGVGNVVNALFEKGIELALDDSDRWTPESSTSKILSKRVGEALDGPMGKWSNAAYGDDVLVWTSKCPRGGHGSEYPMVKARGLIPTSSLEMVRLLLDSSRSKEYNKMSLGRIDEHCFVQGEDKLSSTCPTTGIQGELKIVRSQSQPPVIRKPVELRLLLHARRLPSVDEEEGTNYLTIGRSIWETEQGTAEEGNTSLATRCEMLLSVNLIRDVQVSGDQWCEITTITHGVSPGIPISIGKRIALAAAAKYVKDIRAVFEA